MNELALFAGAGGGLLGSRLCGWRTVCAVELDDYCRRVLLQRQRDGVLDKFPIWDDVRTFDGRPWRGCVDIVTAGFPCQPFSQAGLRAGVDDERNMWPETIRVLREVKPRFALLENVANLLIHEYSGTIFGELAESGFDARWEVLAASDFGAPHIRERIFILAYPMQDRRFSTEAISRLVKENLSRKARRSSCEIWQSRIGGRTSSFGRPIPDTRNCGVDDRDAFAVDRIAALGNMQVPAVVRAAWELLNEELSKANVQLGSRQDA